jgi:Na+/pantothenate symporter
VRRTHYEEDLREASMWMQIVAVSVVAAVFLVRLVIALYDRPSKTGQQ